jgi:hypothetical protein
MAAHSAEWRAATHVCDTVVLVLFSGSALATASTDREPQVSGLPGELAFSGTLVSFELRMETDSAERTDL